MKRLTYLVVGTATVLALAVSASPVAAQNEGRDPDNHWELGINFNYSIIDPWDGTGTGCTATTATGCDLFVDRSHRAGGILPGKVADLVPRALITGNLDPEQAGGFGTSIGYCFGADCKWQFEFDFKYSTVDAAFDNDDVLTAAEVAFASGGRFSGRRFVVFDDGSPTGDQQYYLFNLNYHFWGTGKVIPYVGGGFGAARFYNTPNLLAAAFTDSSAIGPSTIAIFKSGGDDTSFALNVKGGIKLYANSNFGLKFEVQDIVSFPEFDHVFGIIDLSGALVPVGTLADPSGTSSENRTYNTLIFSVGAFVTF